jgi:hypothetical protein
MGAMVGTTISSSTTDVVVTKTILAVTVRPQNIKQWFWNGCIRYKISTSFHITTIGKDDIRLLLFNDEKQRQRRQDQSPNDTVVITTTDETF